jgi:solute carrier family 25 oxoglutarate transporter 11
MAPSYAKTLEAIKPFVFGGVSGICATSCIQPLDTIKVRIQLMGEGVKGGPSGSLIGTGSSIVRNEGFMALYSGYSAAVLRQAVYGTARLGLFRTFSDKLQVDAHSPLPFYQKACCGLASGAMGALIGLTLSTEPDHTVKFCRRACCYAREWFAATHMEPDPADGC